MKAVYFTAHGEVEQLTYGELADPQCEANDVLVRVRACGLNHADLWVRRGLPFLRVAFPFVLGQDIAREVVAVGPGVQSVAVGARVVLNPGLSCGHCERCLRGDDHLCSQYQLLGKNRPGGMPNW